MFAAATSLFTRTNVSQNYVICTPGQAPSPPIPSSSGVGSVLPVAPPAPPFKIGLWRVQSASHKITGKRVSVWSFDKRGPDVEKLGPQSKERVVEVLKSEVSALSRLRHPCILEIVEPLEDTRWELTFATEPLLSTLAQAIPTSSHSRSTDSADLDEVEIQKGVLQVSKGLDFLHQSAKLVHANLAPWTVLINAAGDWKIAGLAHTIPLVAPDGSPTRWEFPEYHSSLPSYIQRSFDYLAPEYALDEQINTQSDMYSLGCILYAVHNKGLPPFRNHSSLSTLRSHLQSGITVPGMEAWDPDLQSLIRLLLARHPASRPTPSTLSTNPFFNSISISTLNFLDRSTFASKPREEKIAFMKGLTNVLGRFSEGLRARKILPSLLEEMKDPHLLPSILPNVFAISANLSPSHFASQVLPSLKPLFAVKEPPQNMMTLLDNLDLLQGKCDKAAFREHVLPLVYNALESEHAVVQERALLVVPGLCETIDYAEVQSVLFPRVALVFTKTRILSVKVNTLACFLSMVKTLDQVNLTQKLVPLLAKIRTKEPAVMLATLNVHEAMGQKVDREAVATLVLPQLWTMTMGPLLNVDQFARFMSVIKTLGERIEREHSQYLRDSQRIEDRSSGFDGNATYNGAPKLGGTVDFQTLVGGPAMAATSSLGTSGVNGVAKPTSWEDDIWGSILDGNDLQAPSPPPGNIRSSLSFPVTTTQSLPSTPKLQPAPLRPIGSTVLNAPAIAPPPRQGAPISPPISSIQFQSQTSLAKRTISPPMVPNLSSTPALTPIPSHVRFGSTSTPFAPNPPPPISKPNYNIPISSSGASMTPAIPAQPPSLQPFGQPLSPSIPRAAPPPIQPLVAQMSGNIMAPSAPTPLAWNPTPLAPKKITKNDWGDFDPLK